MGRAASAAVAAGLLLIGASGCAASIDSFNPVTDRGRAIADLFGLTLVLSAVVFLLVLSVLFYVLTRFRARPGDPDPPQIHGNTKLEIGWTIAPLLLLVVLFLLTVRTQRVVEAEMPGALRVKVIGHQWWWEYQYPELGLVTANELHLPVGRPVKLELEGADVIHSYWVPQLGWKKDTIPGKTNDLWAQFDQAGVYDGACTEYCGTQHAWMRVRLVAEPGDQFDAWVRQQQQPAPAPASETALRGQAIFLQNTCVNCHAVAGTPANARVGPDLSHFGSRSTIGSGVLDNTPDALRLWLAEVQRVKPGALMPNYNALPEDDLRALVEYLEGLK
jgi:cytochrome c oxidase subunit 2